MTLGAWAIVLVSLVLWLLAGSTFGALSLLLLAIPASNLIPDRAVKTSGLNDFFAQRDWLS